MTVEPSNTKSDNISIGSFANTSSDVFLSVRADGTALSAETRPVCASESQSSSSEREPPPNLILVSVRLVRSLDQPR